MVKIQLTTALRDKENRVSDPEEPPTDGRTTPTTDKEFLNSFNALPELASRSVRTAEAPAAEYETLCNELEAVIDAPPEYVPTSTPNRHEPLVVTVSEQEYVLL